jgi:integrase
MPIYKGRRPGTWRVTIYVAGKQREWLIEGNRADARRFEEDTRIDLRVSLVASSRTEMTFYRFCRAHYGPHAAMHLGANTWEKCRRYQLRALSRHFGKMRLSQVATGVASYKESCLARKVEASTINHDLKTLRTMLRWARKEKLLDVVPEFELLPERGQRRARAWTLSEIGRLYAAAGKLSTWLVPLLHFLLDTGCRKGELVACDWSWVDWQRELLVIPVTEVWQPKDKDERDVPLSPALLESLRARRGEPTAPMFPSRFGERYARFPDREFQHVVEAAGLRGGPHTTRHTFASHFLQARPDLVLLAQVMGHSTTRVTELYAHFLPDHLEKARGAVQLSPGRWLDSGGQDVSTRKD